MSDALLGFRKISESGKARYKAYLVEMKEKTKGAQ